MWAALWSVLLELAPWLLFGMLFAGLLHGFVPAGFVRRQLRGTSGVFKAVLLGVPLPLCSCGVIPAGLGLKKDTPEERSIRINHHNSIWGPFGRNLHEDLIGVQGQGTTMQTGSEPRRILHGRHENQTIHDENGMRHFYEEWGKMMNRNPADPMQEYAIAAAE